MRVKIAVASGIIFAVSIAGFSLMEKTGFYDLARFAQKNCIDAHGCKINMSKIFESGWDNVYYYSGGASKEILEEKIGSIIKTNYNEICEYLIFTKNDKIISMSEECSVGDQSDLYSYLNFKKVYPFAEVMIDKEGLFWSAENEAMISIAKSKKNHGSSKSVFVVDLLGWKTVE